MAHHIYQETTTWADSMDANHIYVFNERPTGRTATAIAYVPAGSDKVHKLKTPLKLDLKGRTFAVLA
jgi:hypothetical protein